MAPRTSPKPAVSGKQTTLGPHLIRSGSAKSTTPSAGATARKQRSAAAQDASDGRVETDVLLAILPVHLRNIASRQKNHEYRKYRLQDGVERLWFYETRGTKEDPGRAAITHIATIPPTTRHTPGNVPEEPEGIGNADFNAGLKVSKYGYPILGMHELVKPVTLEEMKTSWGLSAPMGWSYVRRGLWESQWGDEEGREERLKRLF
ncbi:hypothetical protein BBAD15_g5707 [Beauveria bassiana D1-5]|uniref:PUA-like domain protein n=1 Tax=Beauveria bassiana D1-5 TaxID=1245745 RepID=A0A0A2VS01_BEABA|nr:hypothetical protein BBAD15_g5707 [Beauveria bassiana D1-5]